MIDVNDLDGLLELANDYVDDGLHFLTEPVSYGDLVILVERIIAAEKDAARYRWLKGQQWFPCEAEWFMPLNTDADNYEFSLAFDAAIDEGLQCNK